MCVCACVYVCLCVCAMEGRVWHLLLSCCGYISSTQLIASVFIAGVEQPLLCSAAEVEREHFVPLRVPAGVHLLPWSDCVNSCNAPVVYVQMAGSDHYSPVSGLTLKTDQYQ